MMGFVGLLALLVNLLVVAFLGVWIGSRITDGLLAEAWGGIGRIWRHHTARARAVHSVLPLIIAVDCWVGVLLVHTALMRQ